MLFYYEIDKRKPCRKKTSRTVEIPLKMISSSQRQSSEHIKYAKNTKKLQTTESTVSHLFTCILDGHVGTKFTELFCCSSLTAASLTGTFLCVLFRSSLPLMSSRNHWLVRRQSEYYVDQNTATLADIQFGYA